MSEQSEKEIEPENGSSSSKSVISSQGETDMVIPEEAQQLLENLPENAQRAVLAIIRQSWQGPLPPPDVLREYNEIIPNGAERIFKMAENQSQHRLSLEKDVINKEQNQSSLGQIFGFIIAVAFGAAAFTLAITGHEISGTIIGTVDLVALVSVFVLGKKLQNTPPDNGRKTEKDTE